MRYRKIILPGLIIIIMVAAFYTFNLKKYISPTGLFPDDFKTVCVNRGDVLASVEAQGIIEPENEVLLLSPTTSLIKKIQKVPGSRVNRGDVILYLETRGVEEQIEKLEEQLEVKRNNLEKNRLNARSTKLDLDYNVEIKKLRIASIKSDLADKTQLLEVGGISPAGVDKTKQELVLAEKDLQNVEERNLIRLKQLQADEQGLLLDLRIQQRQLESLQELLTKLTVRAPSSGIIMSVQGREGERVNADQLLVRMSDLSTYKVIGSIGEQSADLIKTGKTVYTVLDHEKLTGKIGNIMPMIQNNKVQFDVFLEQSNHPKLLPNLKVELMVVQERRDSLLRIPVSEIFEKGDKHSVFVINNTKAIRKEIITGLKGQDFLEIVEGVIEGDCIIISDISRFKHLQEFDIKRP